MRGSSRLNVAYARAGAGMAIAALLATAAVAPVDVGSVAGPAPDDVEALEVATGQPLPVAYDDDGQPLPAEVGDPPVVEAPSPADELIARAERAVAAAAETPPPAKARPGEPDPAVPVVDEATLLVSFDDGTGQADVDAALASAGVAGRRIEGTTTVVVDLVDADRAAVTAALDEAPGVAKVEPNLVRSADRVPNDPQRAAQDPYLTTLGLPAAWDVADTGAKVTVAVLDTGVDLDHPDLAPNLVAGYNALQPGQAPADDNGHGTAVAGLIGAATNNGVGVAGVAWNARIMPVKVLDSAGNGTDVGVSQGIRWAVDHGADVINLSLGGPGASTPLLDAVDYAIAHDVVVVAASGNDGVAVPSFPAAAPGVLSVGATDVAGKAAWFSNHGPWVLLSAPGVAVRTTASGTGAATEDATGTSFSSPIVAGVAALLLERHPSWTWDSIAWQLLRTARDAGPAGADDAYGFGVVDAAAALGVAPVGPTTSPSTAGDAANLPSSPRVIPVGTTASEPFAYESDEDWLAFDVPALRTATVTVTPPAPSPTVRAAEMDPMLELYGPGGGLLASADATFLGQPEELVLDLEPGRHVLRVRNYYASASPAPYTVRVDLTTPTRLSHAPWATIVDTAATERSLVVADFSGDGRDDLAVTTSGDGTPDDYGLHVATQQADGTLGEPVLLPTHLQYPGADQLAAGDLDGDGDLDLALTTELGLDVAWNDGDGLTAPVLVPSEQRLQGIRSGDLEGDGRDELLVFTQDDLELVRWSGSEPTFTPTGIEVPSGPTRRLYDLGDVTGDGRDDLTVVDLGLVTVRPQQADGSWGEPVAYPNDLDDTPDDLTVDDVTGDGRDDVVMVGGGNGGWLTHLVQQPDGTLGAPVVLDSLDIPVVVAVGDVTGDGRPDAVATHTGYEGVSVYEQRPDGTLAPERLLPAPSQTWDRGTLSLGDLNGDGLGDVNYVPNGAGVVTIRQRYGVPTPEGEQAEVLAASPAPHATGVATTANVTVTFGHWVDDMFLTEHTVCLLNGRSGGCLPVTEHTDQTDPRRVIVDPMPALQPGTPYQLVFSGLPVGNRHVTAVFPFVTAGTPGAATPNVAGTYWPFRWDLGGDGYDDVVWFNPAAGTDPVWVFGPNGRVDTGTTVQGTLTPLAGDFDGNGYEDVFWYAPGTAVDTMWFDGPDGLVAQNFPVSGTYVPVVGDFDRNGYDDIFWYGPGTVGESVWRFRAGRQYTAVAQPAASAADYRIVAGDFDRDGYDDIVWHRPGTGAESLWRGGPTAFTPGPLAAANGNYQLRAGDADGDGYDDVYWFATGSASLWRGSAAGFVAQAAPVVGTGSRPVVGDFGADGRDDLLGYVPGAPADPLYRGKTGGW